MKAYMVNGKLDAGRFRVDEIDVDKTDEEDEHVGLEFMMNPYAIVRNHEHAQRVVDLLNADEKTNAK